jgi:hypothetical protein
VTVGDPTEIEGKAALTTTPECSSAGELNRIGSIVVVPSDAKDGVFGVKLVAGVDRNADDCEAPAYEGCIVARRIMRFVPHTELFLPITLWQSCVGEPCEGAETTCARGQCITARVPNPEQCIAPDRCGDDQLAPCTDTQADPFNCGQCGHVCSRTGAQGVACVEGRCEPACEPGRLDCATPPAPADDDGCEALDTDATTCGACQNDCSASGGACLEDGGFFRCACTMTNACGGGNARCEADKCKCYPGGNPGNHCTYGELCINDVCLCNGDAQCDGLPDADGYPVEVCCPAAGCVNLRSDPQSCGGCGRACPAGSVCENGVCSP